MMGKGENLSFVGIDRLTPPEMAMEMDDEAGLIEEIIVCFSCG